jgi:hypothetical protein
LSRSASKCTASFPAAANSHEARLGAQIGPNQVGVLAGKLRRAGADTLHNRAQVPDKRGRILAAGQQDRAVAVGVHAQELNRAHVACEPGQLAVVEQKDRARGIRDCPGQEPSIGRAANRGRVRRGVSHIDVDHRFAGQHIPKCDLILGSRGKQPRAGKSAL